MRPPSWINEAADWEFSQALLKDDATGRLVTKLPPLIRRFRFETHSPQTTVIIRVPQPSPSGQVRFETMKITAQFQYFKIQRKTIDITARLRGINPTNSIVYSPEPRAEVYCLTLNFKISKLGYFRCTRIYFALKSTKSARISAPPPPHPHPPPTSLTQ